MYFDDAERQSPDEFQSIWPSSPKTWGLTRSEEKQQAVQQLVGHTPQTAASLSVEEVEDETLKWAVESDVLWAGEDTVDETPEDESVIKPSLPTTITSKYESIADLIVANDCSNSAHSLALIWRILSNLMKNQETNSVYMVVFPNASALWAYDVMVTLLQAVVISKSLLPPNMQNLQLDMFHPNFKNSPRMWSPESHSPFPTLGISISTQPTEEEHVLDDTDGSELEQARARLESLFEMIDADETVNNLSLTPHDERELLQTCKNWLKEKASPESGAFINCEWVVDSSKEPFAMYATLWDAIAAMESSSTQGALSTNIVAPNLDAHTTHRLAITVNAALQRLGSSTRVSNVMYPGSASVSRQSPFPMIQLSSVKS